MLKKLLLILLIFSSLSTYNNSFADDSATKMGISTEDEQKKYNYETSREIYNESLNNYNQAKQEVDILDNDAFYDDEEYSEAQQKLSDSEQILKADEETYNKATNEYKQTETYKNSEAGQKDLSSEGFQVKVSELSPGNESEISKATTTEQVINMTLGNIIQKLMIGLGSVSLLVMTFGGGYMIFFHGQDELLSKGKSMFTSGIIALIVSLSSYYMVDLLRFILYS